MAICQTFLIGLGLMTGSVLSTFNDPPSALGAPAIKDPQACVATLTWTADTQGWPGGDWDGGVLAAANYTGEGYSDWRLPTVTELQAALQSQNGQPPAWGQDLRNPGGITSAWTSKSQGTWAWRVKVGTDSNGFVIPSQSGAASKVLKGSNFARTKFVRP